VSARCVLVADHPGVFRSGVSSLLAEDARYDVVEVDNAGELVAAARSRYLDLALVDVTFAPGSELRTALGVLRSTASSVIVWGFEPDPATALAALQAGADGYLYKDIAPSGLLRALDAAIDGEAVLPRDLVGPLIDCLRNVDERHRAREMVLGLSPREREVLAMVAAGARNKHIALSLQISEFTVKRHVQNILRKLDLPSRKVAAMLHRSADGSLTDGFAPIAGVLPD
jgi:two-component system, NarL family, nitrate/nitrite response regulator NarL